MIHDVQHETCKYFLDRKGTKRTVKIAFQPLEKSAEANRNKLFG